MAPLRTAGLAARGCLHRWGDGDKDVSSCGEWVLISRSMISMAERAKLVVGSDWILSLVAGVEECY